METPADIPDWLRGTGLHVVASSRYDTWPSWAGKVEVRQLPRDAARVLLLETSGRETDEGLETLLEALAGLPLALVQAGAFLRENESESFADYAESLASRIAEAPDDWQSDQALVAATYRASIDRADAKAPGARAMLTSAAFFAPDEIPLALLLDAFEDEAAKRASDALARYSLWRRQEANGPHGPTFGLHRLLQTALRAELTEDAYMETAKACARRLAARFEGNPGDVRTWPINAPLAQHALALSNATPDKAVSIELASALGWTDQFFQARSEYLSTEGASRRAFAIDEAAYGSDHPSVATRLNNLAQLLRATNRLAEAEPLMRRALEIDEAAYGTDHPNVAIRLNNLASLLRATNRLAEAEPMMRRALEIYEVAYGSDHPSVATSLNNLASLLQATNRLAEAEPLMRRALEIDKAAYGADHPNVAIRLSNLASLLQATNRLAEAEPLMRRVLEIDEAAYGADHPNVAIHLNNLAHLLQATNRSAEAEPLMRRALAIDEAAYGSDHPNVGIRLNNLASLLQATNRSAEAEPLIRRHCSIFEVSYGADHPQTGIAWINHSQALLLLGQFSEGLELALKGAQCLEASGLPEGHPWRQSAQGWLAQLRQLAERAMTESKPEASSVETTKTSAVSSKKRGFRLWPFGRKF